jgi:hypothetical protein
MRTCDVPIVNVDPQTGEKAVCPGHLGKFDDCLAEALWEWSLDDADGTTGTGDFEGHTALIIAYQDETVVIDPDGDTREVLVPAGIYLLFEASTGIVTYMIAENKEQARAIFDANDERYALWDHGCNPNDPAGHEQCAQHDECLWPDWADA